MALIVTAARLGIGRIATVHGEVLGDVVNNPDLQPLLGITFDGRTGQVVKRARSVFDTAVTVHAKGRYEVHTDLDTLAPRMLAGEIIPGLKVGDWPEEMLGEAAD